VGGVRFYGQAGGRGRTGFVEEVDLYESGREKYEDYRVGDPVFESTMTRQRGEAGWWEGDSRIKEEEVDEG
jgi:hypothetical protein